MDKLKQILDKVPGYSGYRERELRRNADKELRLAISAAFSSQVARISRVQEHLLLRGDFDSVDALDDIIQELERLTDRIRTATYGFSGLFDENKIDEAALDRLYTFDLDLTNGVEQTGDLIAKLGLKQQIPALIEQLGQTVDNLHNHFSERSQYMNNFPTDGSGIIETPVYP